MPRLTVRRPESFVDAPLAETAGDKSPESDSPTSSRPLLIGIKALAALLSRSVASLARDDAAGRLPAAIRLGGSKRWRYSEVIAWIEVGCPDRRTWSALRGSR
jgi:predicted DNA-binding transcriptional regulator AlpA